MPPANSNPRKSGSELRLELLIPGLFGMPLGTDPPTPALDRLCACLKPVAAATSEDASPQPWSALADTLGLDEDFRAGWPTAPYGLARDDPSWDRSGFWLHADPVHLRADMAQLRLFDARSLAIQPAEAAQLVDALNGHFQADAMRLEAPLPERWYLRAPTPVDLKTQPLRAVIGASLADAMPSGADARRWNALMNEAQMLMYQSPVNQAREAAGRPMINGLWLSGAGSYQPLTCADDLRLVLTDDPVTLGLAEAGKVSALLFEASETTQALAGVAAGRVLIVIQSLADALARRDQHGWELALQRLDRQLGLVLLGFTNAAGWSPRIRLGDGAGRAWTGRLHPPSRLGGWLRRLTRGKQRSCLRAISQSVATS